MQHIDCQHVAQARSNEGEVGRCAHQSLRHFGTSNAHATLLAHGLLGSRTPLLKCFLCQDTRLGCYIMWLSHARSMPVQPRCY
jgi:hypothetical protein